MSRIRLVLGIVAAIVAVSATSVILLLPEYVLTEGQPAIDGSPAIPASWASYSTANETRRAYNPTAYDCTLAISQSITDDDRRVARITMDCASTIVTHTSRIMQDGQSVDIRSVFEEYEFVLEDLPVCSWDIMHIDQHNQGDSQKGLISADTDCWIDDKGLFGLPAE